MKSLLIALALVAVAYGSPTIVGTCPDFKPMENLDGAKVAGDWFEIGHGVVGAEFNKTKPEKSCKCTKKTIVSTPTGFDSTITFVDENNKTITKKAKGTKVEGTKAKYTMSGEELDKKKDITVTLSVISTDYDNVMLGCACFSDGTKHGYKFAAYSRQKTVPAAKLAEIKETFKTHGITAELKPVDQSC